MDTARCKAPFHRIEQLVRWVPPPPDWCKPNVDGASKGNPSMARAGSVLKGGEWIKGFAANFRICSSIKVELKALLQGLRLAWDSGVKQLMIHMDSLVIY